MVTGQTSNMASVVKVFRRVENDRSTLDDNGTLTYVATYLVEYDGVGFILPQAQTATDGTTAVPVRGNTLVIPWGTGTLTLYFKSSDARREDGKKVAEVLVSWTSDPGFQATNTGRRDVSVTTSGVSYDENTNKDTNDQTVTNPLGDPFPAEIKKTYYDEKITASFTEDSIDTSVFGPLYGKINSGPVTLTVSGNTRTFTTHTLKLINATTRTSISTSGTTTTTAYSCDVELVYRADTWKRKIVNEGYYYLLNAGDDPKTMRVRDVDADGEPTHQKVYLAQDGTKLDTSNADTDVTFTESDIDDEADLGSALAGL